MAFLDIKNVTVKGVSACVPAACDVTEKIYKWDGAENFIQSTGIKKRRSADASLSASDLCVEAANSLINELGWERSDIDALIFVSQTPDYRLPATSCILQHRLGLSKSCFALDISLGCSGWVYALSVISALINNGTIRKGLLLAGDTLTKICNPEDKSTFPLFGDAGTATAVEYDPCGHGMQFCFNTDGTGYEAIIVRKGGCRNQLSPDDLNIKSYDNGVARRGVDLELDGMDVFSFGISKAPKSVRELCEHFGIDKESVDMFMFHQANLMMNEMISKKLKLPAEKVPYSLADFGNTSCASIPLTLVVCGRERLRGQAVKLIACGFGVGLSWGSVYFETDRISVPELIELDSRV